MAAEVLARKAEGELTAEVLIRKAEGGWLAECRIEGQEWAKAWSGSRGSALVLISRYVSQL